MKLSAHKGRYLKAGTDIVKDTLVTIVSGTVETLDGEEKDVIWFEELEGGLVLNKINASTLVGIMGTEETNEMVGKKIVLLKSKTDLNGRLVDCIRIREPNFPPDANTSGPRPEDEEQDLPF